MVDNFRNSSTAGKKWCRPFPKAAGYFFLPKSVSVPSTMRTERIALSAGVKKKVLHIAVGPSSPRHCSVFRAGACVLRLFVVYVFSLSATRGNPSYPGVRAGYYDWSSDRKMYQAAFDATSRNLLGKATREVRCANMHLGAAATFFLGRCYCNLLL